MEISVRWGLPTDSKAIKVIATKDSDFLGFEPEVVYKTAATNQELIVALADNKYLVGFIFMGGKTKDKWTIYQIATARIVRGKGAGKALIDFMATEAAKEGKGIRLKVTTENRVAIAFYQGVGFTIVDVEKPNIRSLYLMEKECLT